MTTRKHGIVYKKQKNGLKVEAFTDADWFQRMVALSSVEAEYMALSLCVQEVLWVLAMLKDMGIEQKEATPIWEDNQRAVALTKNVSITQGRSMSISSTTSPARTWNAERSRWITLKRSVNLPIC
ncbi:polyprotein [Phytophthora megakarya]|uniref:Polyprotein n=1 Tax=Phytophthora megakarya TaxID=4795 RepID=A0A225VIL7_9STRA|nr:polyprotein [Phytophthora megakarya]